MTYIQAADRMSRIAAVSASNELLRLLYLHHGNVTGAPPCPSHEANQDKEVLTKSDSAPALVRAVARKKRAARDVLDVYAINFVNRTTIAETLKAVATHYGLTIQEITGRGQSVKYCLPRQIAMWIARRHTGRSTTEIARRMGNRDHTTIMHGCRKIDRLMQGDFSLQVQIADIEKEMGVYDAETYPYSIPRSEAGNGRAATSQQAQDRSAKQIA